MATTGAVGASSGAWRRRVYYVENEVARLWRYAVISLLRAALRMGKLRTNNTTEEVDSLLNTQEQRWWSVKIQAFTCKRHYLGYAARYVRREAILRQRFGIPAPRDFDNPL